MKNKFIPLCTAFIIFAALIISTAVYAQDNTDLLTKHSIKTSGLEAFNYLLYTPENAGKDMPLIIYLHGGSGKGNDLDLLTSVEGFPQYVNNGTIKDIPAYIIFPQVPLTQKGWAEIKVSVRELIEYICAEYSIDETKISLTGHSMGGTGTWNIALAYPELFSAIAPMSGSIKNTTDNINTLANTPVWAVVGSDDTIVDPSASIDFIAALKEKNPYAKITTFDNATHFDIPALAYLDNKLNIINWLISNVRENDIIDFASNKVSIKIEVPGEYTLIFADYDDNGRLHNLKTINKDFAFGKSQISVPDDITLDTNDKIMLWKNLTYLQCESYIIK